MSVDVPVPDDTVAVATVRLGDGGSVELDYRDVAAGVSLRRRQVARALRALADTFEHAADEADVGMRLQ